jgi:hypothetical protein
MTEKAEPGLNHPGSYRTVSAVLGPNPAHSRGLSAVMNVHAELGLNYPVGTHPLRRKSFCLETKRTKHVANDAKNGIAKSRE